MDQEHIPNRKKNLNNILDEMEQDKILDSIINLDEDEKLIYSHLSIVDKDSTPFL